MKVHRVDRAMVDHVTRNLRAEDIEEVMALEPAGDLFDEVREKIQTPGSIVYVFATDDGEPAVLGGFLPGPARWVCNSFLLATPRIAELGSSLAVAALRMHRILDGGGVTRIQTAVRLRGDHFDAKARRFLRFLGYEEEGVLRAFGRNGESYLGAARIHEQHGGILP